MAPGKKFTLSEIEINFKSPIYKVSGSSCRICPAKLKDGGGQIDVLAKVTSDPADAEREKLRECANIHRMLHDHPAVLKILGILDTDDYFALILEAGLGKNTT